MSCRILSCHMDSIAVMYCSTTDWAFGPVFYDCEEHSAHERVESFMRWLVVDPRSLPDNLLEQKYSEWKAQESQQWRQEDEAAYQRYMDAEG